MFSGGIERPVARNGLLQLGPMFPVYRNQSLDLHEKVIDWFLHDENTGLN